MEQWNGKTWVRVLRTAIWVMALIWSPVGAVLLADGASSRAMAEGTSGVLTSWGGGILGVALGLLAGNFVWGAKRWATRWYEKKWKVLGGIVRTIWGGAWRGLVFGTVILCSAIVIAPRVEEGIAAGHLANREQEWLTGQVGIAEDFRQGKITPDEYLRYMLALGFGTEKLPKEYQTDNTAMMPDILGIIEEYGEQLSKETLEMAFDAVYQVGIEVGLDASGNVAKSGGNLVGTALDVILQTEKAQAYTQKATTLNRAVLASEENFVVFYTDTGEDAISDAQAEELAEMMEKIRVNYQEKLGLEYDFTFHELNAKSTKAMKEVLKANGIDEEAYQTAMAVYVANPSSEKTTLLAFYLGEHFMEWRNKLLTSLASLTGLDEAKWTKSTMGVPSVTMVSSKLDDSSLELVAAHELGHHYQNLYCQAELGKMCPAGKFMTEGGANWMAINVVEEQPDGNVNQDHHQFYIDRGTCYRADELVNEPPEEDACHEAGSSIGYPALAFLQNYYQNVDGAVSKLMGALLTEEPLAYLREQATETEFQETMKSLAQKNLTNEYREEALWAKEIPGGLDLECEGKMICAKEFALRPTAIKYVYLATEEYDQAKVTVTGMVDDVISVLGKKDGKWEAITDGLGKMEYTLEKTGDYEAIAFAVANASVTEDGKFEVELVDEQVMEMVDEEAETESADGCTVLDFPWMMEERWVVCELQMKRGIDLDKAEEMARKTLWMSYKVFTMKEPGVEMRFIAGVDQTRKQAKVLVLGKEEEKVYLLEIKIEEK